MKRAIIALAFGLVALVPALTHAQGKEVIETVTLQPNETKEVAVATSGKIRIGWQHVDDSARKQCNDNCIELSDPASGKSFASLYGGNMGIQPKDGKAVVVFKNVESVPLSIEIYTKPAKK